MKPSAIFQIIGKYIYNKKKIAIINNINQYGIKNNYGKIEIKSINKFFRKDLDIIKLLINKYDIKFLNQYPSSIKESDFFVQVLEHAKNKDKDIESFKEIEIPSLGKFKKYRILQSILRNEVNNYEDFDKSYKEDPIIYFECLKRDKKLIDVLTEDMLIKFSNNLNIAEEVVKLNSDFYAKFTENVRKDKFLMINAIIGNASNFKYMPVECQVDKENLLRLIKYNPDVYMLIPGFIKEDDSFVKRATEENAEVFKYLDTSKFDESFWRVNVLLNHNVYQYASEEIRDNYSITKTVLEKAPRLFEYTSERLKNNKELALMGVKAKGNLLEQLSDELKDDYEVVENAVLSSPFAYKYASKRLKSDKNLVMEIYKNNQSGFFSFIFEEMHSKLLNDIDIVLLMIERTPFSIHKLSREMQENPVIKKNVILKDPLSVLEYAFHLKMDLIQNNEDSDKKIKSFIEEVIEINPKSIAYIPEEWKDKKFYMNYQRKIIENTEDLLEDRKCLDRYLRESNLQNVLDKNDELLDKKTNNIRKKI